MGREANVDSIRALEEQIKEHERTIIKLKRARNSLLNVSTLPPEVLGNIFRWNVTLKDDFDGLEEGSHNFSLVCHYWSEVASRTPELWTFWGNNFEDWEKRYLRSSVTAPFDLVLDGLTHMFGCVSESQQMVLKDRATRDTIRRVHLQSDIHSLLTSIITPLLSPSGGLRTNSLESLILDCEDQTPLDVSFVAHSRLSKLRRLELANCTISSWDHLTSQITLLTTLQLFVNDISPMPTMPQLLSILASNPYIQSLELNQQVIPNDHGDDDESCQIQLHHLKNLRLDGVTGQVFGLLRRLKHPKRMSNLTLNITRCMATDLSQRIGPYLQTYLQRRGGSRNGLGLCLSSSTYITFSVGDVHKFHPSTSLPPQMDSFVSTTVGLNQALPDNVLGKLALDLIAHTPREEVVYFRTCSSLEAVKDLRGLLPNLKALDLYRVPLSAVFPTLDPDGYRALQIFPPSLKFLCLHRPHLNAYNWAPLITFLSHRASSDNQLDTLLIGGPCHMCSLVSLRVRKMVREFKIDDECLESWCPLGSCL